MVNFSSNNQAYIRSETSVKTDSSNRNPYTTKHKFQCRDSKRIYTYFQFTDVIEQIYQFTIGEIYVLTGLVNVQGFAIFLILKTFKVDEKSKLHPVQKLMSVDNAENSISPPISDNS